MTDIYADALRQLSEPWPPGGRVKAAIERAAQACGLSFWRTHDIWYRRARAIRIDEAEAIADALEDKREREASRDLQDLRTQLERLQARLHATDPDFHRHSVDALRVGLHAPRLSRRPVAGGHVT